MAEDGRRPYQAENATQYTDEAFLDAVRAVSQSRLATTADVASTVGCSHDTAGRRLNALAERGVVEKQEVRRTYVWSPATPEERS